MYERTPRLPFGDNFPVGVQLSIFPESGGYVAYISTGLGKWHRFSIRLKQHDIEELNTELQQAIEQVSCTLKMNSVWNEALSKLAQKGTSAFKRIFADGVPREIIRKALKAGHTLQISSEHFMIPWELLYDGPLGVYTDASCFWGMQYIVSRALIQDARPGDLELPVIEAPCPHMALITCHELEHVAKKEIPTLQELHRRKQLFLLPLRPLNAQQRDEELTFFGQFLREEELHIIHFACHAREKKPKGESYFLVSNEFPISMEDFLVRDFRVQHSPFVVLNACLTGTMSPLYTWNWAAQFWEYGARGVLATEFHVPDWFAADFIGELYKHFLSGEPIGETLLAVRHHFWKEHHNPLGLAYALYSSPSVRIENEGK